MIHSGLVNCLFDYFMVKLQNLQCWLFLYSAITPFFQTMVGPSWGGCFSPCSRDWLYNHYARSYWRRLVRCWCKFGLIQVQSVLY